MSGILPPLTEQSWEAELDAYRTSPQYKQINSGMNISEFKHIYWLEYIHRALGRITGLVFIIPFLYYAFRRKLDKPLTKRMALACILVAAQGAVGWLMVKSGLVDDPRVSPIRLALHLSMAFGLFSLLTWTVLQLKSFGTYTISKCTKRAAHFILLLLIIQIIYGAFMAGTDAGYSYNTYPLMDGDFVPSGLMMLEPWHRNFVENIVTVQFQHRMMAILLSTSLIGFILWRWKAATKPERKHLIAIALLLTIQFKLGVLTLIMAVPIGLAATHQIIALLLLATYVALIYRYRADMNK